MNWPGNRETAGPDAPASAGRGTGPTPAERARTTLWISPSLCVHSSGAHETVGVHGSGPDGSLILVIPYTSPLAGSHVLLTTGSTGEEALIVAPDDFAAASPDPLAADEAHLLDHLVVDHRAELALLGNLLPAEVKAQARQLLPVAIDRYGLTLRVTCLRETRDARLPFRRVISSISDLPEQMRDLLCQAAGCTHPQACADGHPPVEGSDPGSA